MVSVLAVFGVIVSSTVASADTIGASSDHRIAIAPQSVSQAGEDCASLRRSADQVGTVACLISPESLPGQAQRREELQRQLSAPAAVVCTAKDQLFFNRTESCLFEEVAYRLIDLQTGKEVGFADMAVKSLVTLDTRTRTWTQRINATVMIAEGAAKLGTAGFATATCSSGCTATNSAIRTLPYRVPVDFDYQVTSAGSNLDQLKITPSFTFQSITPAVWGPIREEIGSAVDVRCDSTPTVGPNTGGCVYAQFTPTYDVSTLNNDTAQVAWHIQWAQRNLTGKWGRKGFGPELTRTMDATVITANRNAACPASIPRPTGKSCDEYPFASTYQGGSLNPDHSCYMVPATQNSLEGSRYRRPWYAANRVLDKDKFWVNVVLPAGITEQELAAKTREFVKCPG
ncbi:hypothetical protein [Amycolatopsis sp. WAC 04182]|uniref:NucA/NucB deoxyribonuclease domain-containing protein n=1 Tax=Amycolatopsis sp. WAC 04182 TaxID=2203198 RepID=UPI0013156B64|nr:hypothetical protein [Amycolatopsis sp. WAC 04182]